MRRKTVRVSTSSGHSPLVAPIATFFVGVITTLLVSHVLAQSGNDSIFACVNKSSGVMRIVTANDTCRNGETSLTWNVQGPAGPAGPQGAQGAAGGTFPYSCNNCYLANTADRFRGKDLTDAQILRSNFHGADLSGTIFKRANLSRIDFSGANLSGADFSDANDDGGWDNIDGDFSNTNLSNVNFSNSLVKGNFSNANLTKVNFTNANLEGSQGFDTATLTGVTWSNTTCPDGSNSDSHANTCIGHF